MSVSEKFSWKETRPGIWEREVDEVEQFYTSLAKAYEGSGRTFFAMTGHISFSVALPNGASQGETENRVEEALQKAWIHLRYDHPTIASRVEYNAEQKKCMKVYRTLSEKDSLVDWLKTTFRTVSNRQTGIEWCNSDPPVPGLPTLYFIKSRPSDSNKVQASVVLRSHHDIIDGMGTIHLFDNLFAHASRAYEEQSQYVLPEFGNEWANLSPPLRVAANIPPKLRPEQEAFLNKTISHNASLKTDVEIASVPFKLGATIPGKHQRIAITLSEHETRRIMGACKELGFSVTHVYHAAAALAIRDVQQRRNQPRTVRYINYCLINERNNCHVPYDTPAHAASVYHSVSGRSLVVDLAVPGSASGRDEFDDELEWKQATKEFLEIAKEVRKFYLQIRDDPEHISMIPSYWSMATIPYPTDNATPPVPSPNLTPSVSISSMGMVERIISGRHGVFDLEDPWVTGEELGTGLGLFLGTWKGHLTLSAAYNDAWHDRSEVSEFVERCNQLLIRALGI